MRYETHGQHLQVNLNRPAALLRLALRLPYAGVFGLVVLMPFKSPAKKKAWSVQWYKDHPNYNRDYYWKHKPKNKKEKK